MTSKNLAIVWSPNILRCDVSELDTQDALQVFCALQSMSSVHIPECDISVSKLLGYKTFQFFNDIRFGIKKFSIENVADSV